MSRGYRSKTEQYPVFMVRSRFARRYPYGFRVNVPPFRGSARTLLGLGPPVFGVVYRGRVLGQ
jgi:hypothetical protein